MPSKAKYNPTDDTPATTGGQESSEQAHAAAAQARATAYAKANPDRAAREIDALIAERNGYVSRGRADRLALVDEQIRLRGGTPPDGN